MTNEIKEIKEELVKISFSNIGHCVNTNLILDYITNLQEENERYKKIFEGKERFSKIMPDDMDFIILSKVDYDRQQEDIELTAIKMKQRINKAVEYINYYGITPEQNDNSTVRFILKGLLNILRGDE